MIDVLKKEEWERQSIFIEHYTYELQYNETYFVTWTEYDWTYSNFDRKIINRCAIWLVWRTPYSTRLKSK